MTTKEEWFKMEFGGLDEYCGPFDWLTTQKATLDLIERIQRDGFNAGVDAAREVAQELDPSGTIITSEPFEEIKI